MTKKIFSIIFNSILLFVLFYYLTFVNITSLSVLAKALIMGLINIFYYLSIFFKLLKKQKLSRFFYVDFIVGFVLIMGYIYLDKLGVLETLTSVNALKEYILSTKSRGVLVYILIQIAQVVLLPIPAAVICIAGSLIYGPLLGAVYCSVGILIGSYLSFLLGKTFGYRLVNWIVGKELTDKYTKVLGKRNIIFLSLAFLLPMFPDDILCLIAGISKMKFKTFFLVTLLTRPIGVIFMSYFGSGYLIPFSGWGLYVWGVILVLAVAAVYVTIRFQNKFENFIIKKTINKSAKRG